MKICKSILLPIVLYRRKMWSLTLREERIWEQDLETKIRTQKGWDLEVEKASQ
jgi:hypothetical protein